MLHQCHRALLIKQRKRQLKVKYLKVAYNNLIYNRSSDAIVDVPSGSGLEGEFNFIYSEYGSEIEGLESFKKINKNGIYDQEPMFKGYLQEDSILGIDYVDTYKVESTSPCLGVGKKIELVNDFFGNSFKESIGFYCGE